MPKIGLALLFVLGCATVFAADFEYVIPGSGVYNDSQQGFEPIVPGSGILNEQAAAAPAAAVEQRNPHRIKVIFSD